MGNSNLSFATLVKREKIEILMEVDTPTVERLREAIEVLVKVPDPMGEGDNLKITYSFYIDYYGKIVKALTAVETIIDDPETVISQVDCEMLEEGRILVFEVLRKLDDVIRKVKGVTAPATEDRKSLEEGRALIHEAGKKIDNALKKDK